jgi:hypothetical protein
MRLALLLLVFSGSAFAHAFSPSLLELQAVAPDRYRVGWRGTAELVLPCPPEGDLLDCRLEGKRILVRGLDETDVLVRITRLDGAVTTAVLRRESPSLIVPERVSLGVLSYVRLGITHILFGFDHLLFVLAMVLLVERRLILTLTAFTLAHSLTLALAVLGMVRVPQAPVEAAIALSLLCVAVELTRKRPGLTAQKPWLVAFAFGLLHGLGFAGALGEIGLPEGQIAAALACFNVGVELGQLAFVGVLLTVGKWVRLPRQVPAYVVGSLAAFWCLERITGFWS